MFAAIVVNRPPNPDYLLVARIDEQEHYQGIGHPAPLYETMKLAAKLWPPVGPQSVHDDALATPRLRFYFCLFQLVAWLGVGLLALLVTRASGVVVRITTMVIVAAAAASPIAVVSSTELQVDGSVGALMVGVMAAATCLAARRVLPVSVTYATFFIAATVLPPRYGYATSAMASPRLVSRWPVMTWTAHGTARWVKHLSRSSCRAAVH